MLLAAGCAASQSPAAGSSQRPSAAAVPTQLSGAEIRAQAHRYLAIARPANHRLEVEVDGYRERERNDLAAAQRYLRAQAATERQAQAASLASLRSLDRRHQAADAAVETWVRQMRGLLGLPPPSTS